MFRRNGGKRGKKRGTAKKRGEIIPTRIGMAETLMKMKLRREKKTWKEEKHTENNVTQH